MILAQYTKHVRKTNLCVLCLKTDQEQRKCLGPKQAHIMYGGPLG